MNSLTGPYNHVRSSERGHGHMRMDTQFGALYFKSVIYSSSLMLNTIGRRWPSIFWKNFGSVWTHTHKTKGTEKGGVDLIRILQNPLN